MKPINLKFSGLNSFIKPQEIDFNELSSGVFGIFGKTGSGKTTILDAIMLALYGQISKNTKAVDFINSKSEEAYVELSFETGDEHKKTYFVERKYRRRKDTAVAFAWFGEIVGKDKQTLAEGARDVDAKIKEVIGLSFNEFSKCIALPQGEFAGFLNATQAERTEIISNIFSLQEYGEKLVDKVKSQYGEAETKRQVLEAQKAMLKPTSTDDVAKLEEEIQSKKEEILSLTKKKESLEKDYLEKKRIVELFERKQDLVQTLESLYKRRGEILEKNTICEKQKRAVSIAVDLSKVEELKRVTDNLKEQVVNLREKKIESQNKYDSFVSENEQFEKSYQDRLIDLTRKETALIGAVEDEMIILSLKSNKQSIEEDELEIEKELQHVEQECANQETELFELKRAIEEISKQLEKLENDETVDFTLKEIKDIESEIIIYETLEKQVEKIIDNAKEELEENQIEYQKLVKQEKEYNEDLLKQGYNIEYVLTGEMSDNLQKLNQIQVKICKIDDVLTQVALIDELIANRKLIIQSLRDVDNSDFIIAKENKEIELLNKRKDRLYLTFVDNNSSRHSELVELRDGLSRQYEREVQRLFINSNNKKELIDLIKRKTECGTRIAVAKENQQVLLDLLFGLQRFRAEHELLIYNARERLASQEVVEDGEPVNDIKEKKSLELRELLQKQSEKTERLATLQITKNSLMNKRDSFVEKLTNLSAQIEQKEAIYNQIVKGSVGASAVLSQVRKDLRDTKERFEYNKEKTEKLKVQAETALQNFKINANKLDDKVKELSDVNFILQGRVFDLGFKDIDEAKSFIVSEKEILALQEEIENYKQEVALNEKELSSISEKLGLDTVSKQEFVILQKSLEDLTEKTSQEQVLLGTMMSSLNIMKEDYKKLKEIQEEMPKITKMLDDAKELLNLLRGKALVEFIAEEYMQEITTNANSKLYMLLDGRYELEFSEGDFVVYDNFNDHKPRVVQTLSGGETFLVSLSLALAISETISFSSNKNMEFFFLDEGFGTLDSELVESVISALYKLESHNLKIGLISHVKELEEEIKNKVIVTKATDTEGSSLKVLHMI